MKIGLIIQARMNSARLPGKMLRKIGGKPTLEYLIDRVQLIRGNIVIVVATSVKKSDDDIERFCISNQINYFRGSLDDVALRMLTAAKKNGMDAFIRINGDSPFINQKLIDRAISIFENGNFDLVTNVFPRSFPVGQSVEIIKTSTFDCIYKMLSASEDSEHVTKYIYDHYQDYKIQNFSNKSDQSMHRLVLDTPEDLTRITKIIKIMTKPHYLYSVDELIFLSESL